MIGVDGRIPGNKPEALAYMGLTEGKPIAGTKVDRVFIGSCTNSRLPDLRAAAAIVRGRKAAKHVKAWVVPGSWRIKQDAEAEGLHQIFLRRRLRMARGGLLDVRGASTATTSSRRRAASPPRTAISSAARARRRAPTSPVPPMAAAAALAGEITDVRSFSQ